MSSYALEGPQWASPNVTWSFAAKADATFSGTVQDAYQATVASAFAAWSNATGVVFSQVGDSAAADIRVGWEMLGGRGSEAGLTSYTYTNGPTEYFLPGTTVALEDPAQDPLNPVSGQLTWDGTVTTLYQVALHEIGHALGLDHSALPTDVMYPTLGPSNRTLSSNDIAGVSSLYGGPAAGTVTVVPQAAPPTMTSAQVQALVAAAVTSTPTSNPNQSEARVSRFFDSVHGTQFMTSSAEEAASVLKNRPDLVPEGTAFMSAAASDKSGEPVFRFFDTRFGTHFYTASSGERDTILATRPDMKYEGAPFWEQSSQQAGSVAVGRFFDTTTGTHFFTADANEKANIQATMPSFKYEGTSFWAPSA